LLGFGDYRHRSIDFPAFPEHIRERDMAKKTVRIVILRADEWSVADRTARAFSDDQL
jgi:hypothetical protein